MDKNKKKKFRGIYKENRKKFHLDFIPDYLCSELDCLNSKTGEIEFCSKIGCPIKKLYKDLEELEIDGDFKKMDTKNIVESSTMSISIKNALKLKWDYMRLGKDYKAEDTKFRIIYFTDNNGKRTVIHEPFPKNRFDTEFDAIEFLEKYCRETEESPEDYYVASIIIRSDKKKT